MSLGRWGNFTDEELEDLYELFKVYFGIVPESPSEGRVLDLEEQIGWEMAVREDLGRESSSGVA